jgi:hypothetical protein
MPWGYFQAAQPDQQVEYLCGGEWIALEGLHPTWPRLQTRLPAARGAARVLVNLAGAANETPVALVCDRLIVEPDRQALSLTWRGRYEIRDGDQALRSLVVLAALESPHVPASWARLADAARRGPLVAHPSPVPGRRGLSLRETAGLDPYQADASWAAPPLPFLSSGAPTRPAGPSRGEATPWATGASWPSPTSMPSKASLVETTAWTPPAPVGIPKGTGDFSEVASAPRSPAAVLPFDASRIQASAAARPSTAATPWGAEPLRPAPTGASKGTLVLEVPVDRLEPPKPPPDQVAHAVLPPLPPPAPPLAPSSPPPTVPPPLAEERTALPATAEPPLVAPDPWARPPIPTQGPPPTPPPQPPTFDRPAAGAFKGSVYGKFGKKS